MPQLCNTSMEAGNSQNVLITGLILPVGAGSPAQRSGTKLKTDTGTVTGTSFGCSKKSLLPVSVSYVSV